MVASDNAFAMEVSQIYKQMNIKTTCSNISLLTTIDLFEVELSSRAQEEEEGRRRQKNANVAVASFTSTSSGKGSKPTCRDFLTDNGCTKGGQCTFQHPNTVRRCLRCGSTKHTVADCKRPRRDSTTSPGNKGKGKNKNASLPKSSSQTTAGAKANPKPDAKKKPNPAAKPKGKGKQKPRLQPHLAPLLRLCTL